MSETTSISRPTMTGVVVERPYIRVVFQRGLPQEVGINGCRVEDVLDVAAEKLKQYQATALACEENDDALAGILQAIEALDRRRRRRMEQGVFSTMNQHETIRTEDEDDDFSATSS